MFSCSWILHQRTPWLWLDYQTSLWTYQRPEMHLRMTLLWYIAGWLWYNIIKASWNLRLETCDGLQLILCRKERNEQIWQNTCFKYLDDIFMIQWVCHACFVFEFDLLLCKTFFCWRSVLLKFHCFDCYHFISPCSFIHNAKTSTSQHSSCVHKHLFTLNLGYSSCFSITIPYYRIFHVRMLVSYTMF